MLCPKCHTAMNVIRYSASTGKDGRTTEIEHRCVKCWKHITETKKRERPGFQEEANL